MELTKGEVIRLDKKDKLILEQLQKNARLSIAQISKNTNLPRDLVVYRIKRLEETKVIRSHHTMLNPQKLGFPLYIYAFFSCYNISPDEEKKLIGYCREQNQIIYVAKNSGKYDYTIGVCAREYMEFDEILRGIRQKFPNLIKDIEITPIVQEYKFDWMVDLIKQIKK